MCVAYLLLGDTGVQHIWIYFDTSVDASCDLCLKNELVRTFSNRISLNIQTSGRRSVDALNTFFIACPTQYYCNRILSSLRVLGGSVFVSLSSSFSNRDPSVAATSSFSIRVVVHFSSNELSASF
jgi:hypothetical protein